MPEYELSLSGARLESFLVQSFPEVTQAEPRFLLLLRELDLSRRWGGLRQRTTSSPSGSSAECLNWRCGISRTTVQEKVRVVRALSRVATEVNETELLSFARELSYRTVNTAIELRGGQQPVNCGHSQPSARLRRIRHGILDALTA